MAEERELILKLGKKITDRIPYKLGMEKLTVNDPEYWGLAGVVTDEMAEVALCMDVRKPITLPKLAKKTKKPEAELEKLLQEMAVVGIIEYNWENPQHEKQYILPMYVPGSAEFMVMNKEQVEKHTEIADFFENMSRLPLEKVTPMVPLGGAGIGMHVIPVEKAIPAAQESADVEHISHWLKKYKDKYAIGQCSCRLQQRVRGEGTGDIEGEWCIGVGDMADFVVQSGRGHYVELDEVLELLERAEKMGYVHQITNIDGEDKIFAICNCAVGVCNAAHFPAFNTPNMSCSAYRAHVTKENCGMRPLRSIARPVLQSSDRSSVQRTARLPIRSRNFRMRQSGDRRSGARITATRTRSTAMRPVQLRKTACPAHVPVQGYVKMAAEGRYMDALKLIKNENPFPAVCGSICNRRCEDACTRGTIDQAVAIDEIKKFIAEQEMHADKRYIPEIVNHLGTGVDLPQKIAIVGGGPAGLSAAFYCRKMGYPVTVFEKESRPGGMLLNGIPSFRLEKNIIDAEIEVLRQMGVTFKCGVEVGKDVTIQQLREEGFKAFYVAIGAQGGRKAGVPGEDADGVKTGVEFLRSVNLDESTKLSGRTVVVGGGNVAVDVARAALRAGSGEVSMFCLESRDIMPAAKDEVAEAEEEGISVNNSWGPKEILTENGKVKAIVFKKCLSVKDADGRFNPQYDENDLMTVECENVLSIGQSIVWGDLLKGTKVEIRPNGGAIADPVTYQTAEPYIFVGGDVYTGPRFAIDAIAAGKEGFVSMHRFVNPGQSLTLGRNRREFIELDKNNIDVETFDNAKRQIPGTKAGVAKETFRDLRCTLTEEQIKTEAKRCLGCGASVVDENKCIGCGICTTKCEFDAIHLTRDLPDASRMEV